MGVRMIMEARSESVHSVEYVQPRWEFLLRKGGNLGFAILLFTLAIGIIVIPSETGDRRVVAFIFGPVLIAFSGLIVYQWLFVKPYRLFGDGIQYSFRGVQFWPYSDIRDAQLLTGRRGRPAFLFVTHRDGTKIVVGRLFWTKNVTFKSHEFDRVATLVQRNVERKGARPAVPWSAEAWAAVEPLFLRGGLVAQMEKRAQAEGVPIIDAAFVSRAISADKGLRRAFAISLVTTEAEKQRKQKRAI